MERAERIAPSPEVMEFLPGLLAIQESPPGRLPRAVLYCITALLILLLAWAAVGHLDIVASANGRLVPESYLKVVQPADAGIVKELLVREGEHVSAGQVLVRLDSQDERADAAKLDTDLAVRSLQLRRIDAELRGTALMRAQGDPSDLFKQAESQYRERHQAYLDTLAQAEAQLKKSQQDFASGIATLNKLRETNPILKSQSEAYSSLGSEGYVARVAVDDKRRLFIENQQDLAAQESSVAGLDAAVEQAQQQINEIRSKYRSDLQNERMDAASEYQKLQQDVAKQAHRSSLLELKAPADGVVKDLATHTVGTVVATGTVLLSIVPENEPLVAEVLIRHEDVGFVHQNQAVKVKLEAFPFQKYGLLDGTVLQVWPDAVEPSSSQGSPTKPSPGASEPESNGFKALVKLSQQQFRGGDQTLSLVAGMQVVAEIREGRRTVLQYLLSPIQGALHDGGRER